MSGGVPHSLVRRTVAELLLLLLNFSKLTVYNTRCGDQRRRTIKGRAKKWILDVVRNMFGDLSEQYVYSVIGEALRRLQDAGVLAYVCRPGARSYRTYYVVELRNLCRVCERGGYCDMGLAPCPYFELSREKLWEVV